MDRTILLISLSFRSLFSADLSFLIHRYAGWIIFVNQIPYVRIARQKQKNRSFYLNTLNFN